MYWIVYNKYKQYIVSNLVLGIQFASFINQSLENTDIPTPCRPVHGVLPILWGVKGKRLTKAIHTAW